jgi:hypothetical protein
LAEGAGDAVERTLARCFIAEICHRHYVIGRYLNDGLTVKCTSAHFRPTAARRARLLAQLTMPQSHGCKLLRTRVGTGSLQRAKENLECLGCEQHQSITPLLL